MSIQAANSPVAENVKRLLAEKGLRNNFVARSMGYSDSELSSMLNGRKIIKAQDVHKFCKTLGVSASELFRE